MRSMCDNDYGRKLGSVSWRRLCIVLVAALFTLEILVVAFYHDTMYSPLNTDAKPKINFHSDTMSNARAYVRNLPPGNSISSGKPLQGVPASQDVALVIFSSKRKEAYLDACLWSLFQNNSPTSFTSTTLTLINTARPTTENTELAHWRQKFACSEWDHPVPTQIVDATSTKSSWVRQGVENYMQALKECMNQKAVWCVVLEEDIVLTRDFLSTFRKVVQENLSQRRIQRANIGMIKLFVSDFWDGFSFSWVHVRDIMCVAVFALLSMLGLFRFCLLPMSAPLVRQRKNGAWCKCLFSYFLCVIGFYLIWRSMGRQALVNMIELPYSIHLDPLVHETAGTVGIAFPATALPHVCDFLVQRLADAKGPPFIDVALNLWLASSAFRALRTTPSLVQHIGAYSSAGYKNQGNFDVMKQDSGFTF